MKYYTPQRDGYGRQTVDAPFPSSLTVFALTSITCEYFDHPH